MVIFTGIEVSVRPSHRQPIKQPITSTHTRPTASRTTIPPPTVYHLRKRRVLIAKFGGSSLVDARHISRASAAVAREYSRGTRIVVVVSAVGRTTDHLLELTNHSTGLQDNDRDDILAMGERTSARIFAASLKSRGIQARYFDPSDRDWPIITDDKFSRANPVPSASIQRIKRYVRPLLGEGIVPVIGGFIGRTREGRISTLGRGGSDTTALLLAKALAADEVVLVTNVDGVMSGDPKLVRRPRLIKKIDIRTLQGLADSGTKFIHRKALRFKDPNINIRVVSHTHGNLEAPGTTIVGEPLPDLEVKLHNPHPAASVTLIGKSLPKDPKLMARMTAIVGRNLLGVSADSNSTIIYLNQTKTLRREIKELHRIVLERPGGVALATRTGTALITVKGVGLEETPGVTAKISEVLRANNINIFGVLTITSSVLVQVSWRERKTAAHLIRRALEGDRT